MPLKITYTCRKHWFVHGLCINIAGFCGDAILRSSHTGRTKHATAIRNGDGEVLDYVDIVSIHVLCGCD